MPDKPPDYTTMSGAEFRRAVGADPKKWATAFVQRAEKDTRLGLSTDNVADWFRGAMDAAVWEQGQLLNWDKPDEHDPAR
jgi:hypothetical protein